METKQTNINLEQIIMLKHQSPIQKFVFIALLILITLFFALALSNLFS